MKRRILTNALWGMLLLGMLAACSGVDSQIKEIQDRGVLRVGVKVDVPRFGYMDPATGEIEGMEVDLARAIAKDILDDEDAVRLINITPQTRNAMLDNGEIDLVIATFTITEERKLSFNFSRPYYIDEIGWLVCADSGVEHPVDMDGKRAGVMRGSTAATALAEELAGMGISVAIQEYTNYPEIKAALVAGNVEAFVTDKSILSGYKDDRCVLLGEGFNPQDYGIASKLEKDKLAARVDALLEAMEKDGRLADIYEMWGL